MWLSLAVALTLGSPAPSSASSLTLAPPVARGSGGDVALPIDWAIVGAAFYGSSGLVNGALAGGAIGVYLRMTGGRCTTCWPGGLVTGAITGGLASAAVFGGLGYGLGYLARGHTHLQNALVVGGIVGTVALFFVAWAILGISAQATVDYFIQHPLR